MTLTNEKSLEDIAHSMGIALYQRFSEVEAADFLNLDLASVKELRVSGKVAYILLPNKQIEFFGFQLLEYLLDATVEKTHNSSIDIDDAYSDNPDHIIRCPEVTKMTGLSRTTLWRLERENKFPSRVELSKASVGWKFSEIQAWIESRQEV